MQTKTSPQNNGATKLDWSTFQPEIYMRDQNPKSTKYNN